MRISDWSSDVCSSDLGSPFGDGDNLKTGRESCDLIAVANPDLMPLALFPEAIKQSTAFSNFDESAPEFSRLAAFHLTAELRHHHLLAITDAKNWNTGLKDRKSTRLNSSHKCAA